MSEHRFATNVVPLRLPAPEARRPWSVRGAWNGLVGYLRAISGLDAYSRYVAHQRRAHPGCPVETEAEFWRSQWDEQERNPKARCC